MNLLEVKLRIFVSCFWRISSIFATFVGSSSPRIALFSAAGRTATMSGCLPRRSFRQ